MLPPCWEPCLLRRVEAQGPRKLSAPVWAARRLSSVRGATRQRSRIPGSAIPLAWNSQPWRPAQLRGPHMNQGELGAEYTPPGPQLLQLKEERWRKMRGNAQARDSHGAEARSGPAGSGRADGRLSCQGPRLAMQTASFLYGNEEFRLMELNHL